MTLRNVGNGTAVVYVFGKYVEVKPGEVVKLNATATAQAAGILKIAVEVNGTEYAREVYIYYYTPILAAEPAYVEVRKLPTNVTLSVVVKNVGNWTGRLGPIEIPPGGTAAINITAAVNATGTYSLQIGGVEVPITVVYKAPSFEIKTGGPTETEALPGEKYPAWLWIKNVGNATAKLSIDGEERELGPGDAVNITKWIQVDKVGIYKAVFKVEGDLNTTAVHQLSAKIVAVKVEMVLWKPELRRGWPPPNGEDRTSLLLESKTAEVQWGYIITSNASKRTVVVYVEDVQGRDYFTIPPKGSVGRNLTATVQAPGSIAVWVIVNGTKYTYVISTQLVPPKVTIRDVSKIEFRDSREILGLGIKCSGIPIVGTIQRTIDIVEVSGVLAYTTDGKTIEGTVKIRSVDVYTGSYRGIITGTSGRVDIDVDFMGGHHVITTKFRTSPFEITEVLIDGVPGKCDIPTQLIPSIFLSGKPAADNELATQYAFRLVSAFKKGDSDVPQRVEWNGEYVEVVDKGGNVLRVYFGQGEVVIEGPLSARLVIS
ncbi:hypothetical protein [Pyrobaculum calidifontis]|uniref:hypothetical protein n=1 Tax=Pyrobaculum calidifontis TaxID=181486 RepID=UPI00186B7F8B|nr:hypothetical protein [Pyrobaculum calidifontis]